MVLKLDPGARLVAATHNPGKARELAVLLDGRFDLVAAGELGLAEPEETETSFVGNAILKARQAADASGLVALADDSGLSVRALDGAPGVYSARWAGPDKDFALAMRKVEARLEVAGDPDRAAWFTCALAVAWPGGPIVAVEGQVRGQLGFPPRGGLGFGYDPIFVPDGDTRSFGEIAPAEKDLISHRAVAFAKLKAALFLTDGAPPLAVYVHWPYCARICPYCDFNVTRDRGQAEQPTLARAIIADLEGQAALTGPRRLGSVFFGGGTPSLMDPAWVAEIIAAAGRLWRPADDLEITLEANPTDAEAARFAALAEAGVQRLSLGVQALDDAALAALGRNHDAAEARRAAALAATLFPRLSIDLIYARAGQTPAAWAAELAAATDLGAEHLSPYQLTIEPGTAFDRATRRKTLIPPDADVGAALYETTQAVLTAAGFEAYEVSNHARGSAARSRHNLAYWRGWDYVGAGPGAHGRLTLSGARTATTAARRVGDYLERVRASGVGFVERAALTARDVALERLLMGLRTSEGVALAELEPLGLAPADPRLGDLAEAGLVAVSDGRLIATLDGRRVLDRLITELADTDVRV